MQNLIPYLTAAVSSGISGACKINGEPVSCEQMFSNLGPWIGGLFAFLAGFFVLFIFIFVLSIGLYIYTSFAFMAIGKKAGVKHPGLAWIPQIGPLLVAFMASKNHWWPWLLFIGVVIPLVNFIAMVVFLVFATIWQWKMMEAVNKPGWWAILVFIPFVGGLVYLILIGIAAWSHEQPNFKPVSQPQT
jgi:hypothetical protein